MSGPDAQRSTDSKPVDGVHEKLDDHARKLQNGATVSTIDEHRAIFSRTTGGAADQIVMSPVSGYSDAKPFTQNIPAKTTDGQGEDVHVELRGAQPGLAQIGLMQPKAPYAATFSEEVQISGKNQEFTFHGIAPASEDGLLLKIQTKGVNAFEVQKFDVEQSHGLTQPAHYSVRDGQVVESQNIDHMGKNALGKDVEMRNGKPFLTGFEIQSVNLQDQSTGQQNIQKFLEDNANAVTVTPYWDQFERNSQSFLDKANWAQSKGLEVKEHPALWDQNIPVNDAQGNPIQITPDKIKEHVQQIARLPGQFTEINETADVNSAPDNGVTRWIKNVGPAKATEQAIAWAKEADPAKTVLYNDYQNGAQEMHMLDQMQKDGKLPDAIGIQLHMDQGNWPLSRVEETINQLAKYGKPIYITEISVLSGENGMSMSQVNQPQIKKMSADFDALKADPHLGVKDANTLNALSQDADNLAAQKVNARDVTVAKEMSKLTDDITDPALREKVRAELKLATTWADTPAGEKTQADYTENLYKVLHSNPHVQGITWWDLSDKNSWKGAPRGWFREDGSPKPVVARMERLFAQWREHAEGQTNAE